MIATRHDTHAEYAERALDAGKHVFVEKPLCLRRRRSSPRLEAAVAASGCVLMVGFNRRFAPLARAAPRGALGGAGPWS